MLRPSPESLNTGTVQLSVGIKVAINDNTENLFWLLSKPRWYLGWSCCQGFARNSCSTWRMMRSGWPMGQLKYSPLPGTYQGLCLGRFA